jgi:hypothetical protein
VLAATVGRHARRWVQADVGLGPKARDEKFGLMHDKAPAPLQLERIDEDAALQGARPLGSVLCWRSFVAMLPVGFSAQGIAAHRVPHTFASSQAAQRARR